MSENKVKWHPYPKEKPEKDDQYLLSLKLGKCSFIETANWLSRKEVFEDVWNKCIKAWAEAPEPYEENR